VVRFFFFFFLFCERSPQTLSSNVDDPPRPLGLSCGSTAALSMFVYGLSLPPLLLHLLLVISSFFEVPSDRSPLFQARLRLSRDGLSESFHRDLCLRHRQ